MISGAAGQNEQNAGGPQEENLFHIAPLVLAERQGPFLLQSVASPVIPE